jgi:predicted acyltransferase
MDNVRDPVKPSRLTSIDGFRGAAVVLMVIGNYAAGIRWVPAALKHQPDIGMTVADVVAPWFIIAVALTVRLSMLRRTEQIGRGAAMSRFAVRCLSLIGIGAIITAGQAMSLSPDIILSWGVLQAIGAAGLLLLPFIFTPTWVRLLVALFYFTLYQILLDNVFLDIVIKSNHNGLLGSLSWGGLLMIGTVLADVFHGMKRFGQRLALLLASGAVSLGLGFFLSIWFPISKHRASVSYMGLCLGISLLVFAIFHILLDRHAGWLPWLQRIGRNPLGLYIAHLLLLGIFAAPGVDIWYAGAPIWLSLIQLAIIMAIFIWLSVFLEKKRWIIKL